MASRTYTVLITIDGNAPHDPRELETRVQADLETGTHNGRPYTATTVHVFEGNRLPDTDQYRQARIVHGYRPR